MAIKLYPDNDQPKPIQMMSQYPIILIPPQIEQVKSAQPSVPQPPTPPQQPGPEPKKLNTTVIGVEAAIAAIGVPIVSQMTSIPGWLLFVLAVGAIASHAWWQITTYPQRLQEHRQHLVEYSEVLEQHKHKILQHQEEVKAARSPERVAKFHYEKLLELLRQTIPHDGDGSNAPTNPIEIKFKNLLNQYFSGKVYKGLFLTIPDFQYPYTPDIAYIDKRLSFYIDIEVDEPYVYHTGQPTHFLGASKDNRRNNFFINRNWVVIRFSEEQVVCYRHSCCKTVAQVINQITKDESILNQFADVPDLQQRQQWTHAEAMQMVEERKRDNYQCQVEIKQQIFEPSPLNTSTPGPHIPISPSPNTNTPHTEFLLAECPYCGVKVRPTKLELHKASRCPKRPLC